MIVKLTKSLEMSMCLDFDYASFQPRVSHSYSSFPQKSRGVLILAMLLLHRPKCPWFKLRVGKTNFANLLICFGCPSEAQIVFNLLLRQSSKKKTADRLAITLLLFGKCTDCIDYPLKTEMAEWKMWSINRSKHMLHVVVGEWKSGFLFRGLSEK